MYLIYLVAASVILASCKNPTQARSASYTEIGRASEDGSSAHSDTPNQHGNSRIIADTRSQGSSTAPAGGKACTSAETATMNRLFPKDCYYMRRIPEKGKEVMLGGKCIEKTAAVLVGQKHGDFYFVCYQNQTGFLHEDAFE